MNANWSLPILTSTYANFLAEMKSRDEDIATWFDGVTSTNLIAGTKRWNSTGNKFEKFNGTAWSDLATLYNINVATANNLNGGNNTTLLGSIPYQSNINVTSLLAPNTTTTRKFLRQLGTGINGAAPVWDTIAASDVPTLNQNTTGSAAKLTTARNINGKAFDGTANIDIEDRLGTSKASAATVTVGTAVGDYIHITGTTTIISLGAATTAGTRRTLIFDAALTLTHHATSLICPGATNITTVAGLVIEVIAETTANWRVVSITHPSLSMAELSYLTNITSDVQTQLNQVATETIAGKIELATTAEAQAGTDDLKAITPLKLKNALNASGAAPLYASRAWVNFNGTGTVAIRASGNVSSITDNGVGDYTVNLTTAMPDVNYCPAFGAWGNSGTASWSLWEDSTTARTVSALRIGTTYNQSPTTARADYTQVNIAILR